MRNIGCEIVYEKFVSQRHLKGGLEVETLPNRYQILIADKSSMSAFHTTRFEHTVKTKLTDRCCVFYSTRVTLAYVYELTTALVVVTS